VLFVRQAFRKDLSRSFKDRVALALYLGIPLVIGGMLLLLMGGDGPKPVAHLLVVDEDETVASGLFQTLLRSEQMSEFLSMEETNRAEGHELIDDGDASALLVIPEGFQDTVLREEPAELELVTNPAETIKPKILTVGMEVVVDAVFYLHRLLGEELRAIVDSTDGDEAPDEEAIANISVDISRVIRKVEKYTFPPSITVEAVADENDRTGGVPLAHLMLPGIILMGLLLMAQSLAADVWAEKNSGTLSRMVSAPQPVASLLFGKILANAVLVFAVSLVLLVIGMLVLEIPLGRLPVALVWSTLSGVTLILLFMWFFVHARTRRAGVVITNSLVYPLLMLGGSFFPSEIMPEWMGVVGRLTPNGWSLENLKSILIDDVDGMALSMGIVGLLAAALLLFYLTAARMRGRFARL
jgi:ABC-type Na+ efflux pump permease subunit